MTASKHNPREADLEGKARDRDLLAEICDLRQTFSIKIWLRTICIQ